MNPLIHAKNSVRRYGGTVDDYLPIHHWMDQTKLHVADLRHRVVLHNSFGIGLCEDKFGFHVTNSDGNKVSVRKLAEEHVIEDIGFIPSLDQALKHTPITSVEAPRLRKVILVKAEREETK
jgi:hypothetical protein